MGTPQSAHQDSGQRPTLACAQLGYDQNIDVRAGTFSLAAAWQCPPGFAEHADRRTHVLRPRCIQGWQASLTTDSVCDSCAGIKFSFWHHTRAASCLPHECLLPPPFQPPRSRTRLLRTGLVRGCFPGAMFRGCRHHTFGPHAKHSRVACVRLAPSLCL